MKRASRVGYATGIRNETEKERNKAARQMDTLMKELSVPLTRYLAAFPSYQRLHPFEQVRSSKSCVSLGTALPLPSLDIPETLV